MCFLMQTLKPFFKVLFLSSTIFFVVVILGMKYHWGKALERKGQTTVLEIPDEKIKTVSTYSVDNVTDQFQPEIIRTKYPTSSPLQDLSKEQINHFCKALFNKENLQEVSLLIGNCVVSNYQEPLRDLAQNSAVSTVNRQKLSLKKNVTRDCEIKNNQMNNARSNIEQKLLIGICVSNTLSKLF